MRSSRGGGADVAICLDVSRSMLAGDLEPTRLEFAKERIRGLLEEMSGNADDRVSLVAFAGEARLVSPLTRDGESFLELLQATDPYSVSLGGTDLGAAIDCARQSLGDSRERPAAVVLLTDGEDHEGRGLEAARACAGAGVPIHAVGLGSPRGSKVALADAGGFLKDRRGRDVITAQKAEDLEAIATLAGGVYVDARQRDDPLKWLHRSVIRRAASGAGAGATGSTPTRYRWPLLAGLALLVVAMLLPRRRTVA